MHACLLLSSRAEDLLAKQPIGYFLIRLSESRFGFSLSFRYERRRPILFHHIIFLFRAEDRCRHYMINQLKNSKYNVIGESKVHKSLDELIDYYRTVSFPLSLLLGLSSSHTSIQHTLSNWHGHLGQPCQADWSQYDHESLIPYKVPTVKRSTPLIKNLPTRPHVRHQRLTGLVSVILGRHASILDSRQLVEQKGLRTM